MADNENQNSRDELNRIFTVFDNVKEDNAKNEKLETPQGLALSQSELDKLFSHKSESTSAAASSQTPPKPALSSEEAAAIRARKIAERKARAAQLLAQANAGSPKRITVVYGTCLKTGAEVEKLQTGEFIQLTRPIEEAAKVYVDGKLFASGILAQNNGKACVQLTEIVKTN